MRLLVALAVAATLAHVAQAQNASAPDSVAMLPLHEIPVAAPGTALVFLITGDGGFAAGDRGMADTFVAAGIPVVALNARAYLKRKRTPEEAARDAARIVRHCLTAWHRDSVVLVGYSRGADIAPFIVNRLPADVRERLSLMAMVGLATHASFEFHWTDLVKDTRRASDYDVAPEVLRIHGVPMLCFYGQSEKGSLCPTFPPSVLTAEPHGGRHAMNAREGAAVARRILRELGSRD